MGVVKDLLLICLFLTMVVYYIKLYSDIKRQRRYFMDTLSHDLKVAALAQIRGLDVLQKNLDMTKDDAELLNDISNSCKFTLDMITMLLNTYQYELGNPVFENEAVDISDLIKLACQNLSALAEEKNIKLVSANLTENICTIGDKSSLLKMLNNLISTAISNANRGSEIYTDVRITNQTIEASITYYGKNLTNEECRKMFFKKTEYATVGHGIKMYLCKKIIDFHKGKICVKNCSDNKTSFTFTLPLAKTNIRTKNLLTSAS